MLPAGSQIPVDRTAPALDLDLLLGGLKPVIQGLNPQDVNALTASLVQIFQGQGGTLESLLVQDVVVHELAGRQQPGHRAADRQPQDRARHPRPRTATSSPASIDKLETAGHRTVAGSRPDRHGDRRRWTTEPRRWPTCLTQARPPLAGTVDQLNRLAPMLDSDKDRARRRAAAACPNNYRKLARLGAYGSFVHVLHLRDHVPRHATCRAAPWSSPGSSKTTEGARNRRC